MSVVNLIQLFTISKRNGMLVLMMTGLKGVLTLDRGQIVHAAIMLSLSGEVLRQGDEAFYDILRWRDARFWFNGEVETPTSPSRTVSADSSELLFEGLRRLDEETETSVGLDSWVRLARGVSLIGEHAPAVNDIARQVLLLVSDNVRRVGWLAAESGLGDLLTLMTVVELLDAGLLELSNPPGMPGMPYPANFDGYDAGLPGPAVTVPPPKRRKVSA
jgi:hypothetical protein